MKRGTITNVNIKPAIDDFLIIDGEGFGSTIERKDVTIIDCTRM